MSNQTERFVITQKFENVFGGDLDMQTGEGVEHFEIEWRIRVFPQSPHFSIDLDCFVGPDYIKWAVDLKIEWRLLSETGWKPIETTEFEVKKRRNPKISFDWKRHGDCFTDDTLLVECHVEITRKKGMDRKSWRRFDESMKEFSDIVLLVEEERFYVSKLFLASQSSHFKSLILENPSDSNELIIDDVDALQFQHYLEMLYGHDPLDDDTVIFLLELGKKYDSPTVMEKCARYLIIESDMKLLEELELAIRYQFDALKNDCLSELETMDDIRRHMPEDISQLSQALITLILEKIISLHR
ncbi:unnamed protein product [Caenorhabditis brenneri]